MSGSIVRCGIIWVLSGPIEELEDTVNALALATDSRSWSNLRIARDLWALYARSMNLFGPGQLDAQIVESLHLVAALERGQRCEGHWVDVGSGGGFPGLVLAAWSRGSGLLIEPRSKRCDFLELVLAKMDTPGWAVVRGRWCDGGVETGAGVLSLGELGVGAVRGCGARAVFSPEGWVQEAASMVPGPAVVAVHLHPGDPDPHGLVPQRRVESGEWSVRLYDGTAVKGVGS